jgi:hypothetical protein
MITESARVVEMPCIPWLIDESGIRPEKGTWTLTPASLQALRPDIQALLSCPNCAAVLPFSQLESDDVDRLHQTGTLTRKDLKCKCGFLFTAKLLEWDKRRLYCVVYEVTDGKSVRLKKEYLHAESRVDAIFAFEQGHMDHPYRLVDAAPVFGYFVNEKDKDRDNLMVD